MSCIINKLYFKLEHSFVSSCIKRVSSYNFKHNRVRILDSTGDFNRACVYSASRICSEHLCGYIRVIYMIRIKHYVDNTNKRFNLKFRCKYINLDFILHNRLDKLSKIKIFL